MSRLLLRRFLAAPNVAFLGMTVGLALAKGAVMLSEVEARLNDAVGQASPRQMATYSKRYSCNRDRLIIRRFPPVPKCVRAGLDSPSASYGLARNDGVFLYLFW